MPQEATSYRPYFSFPSIDHRAALWAAYMNCQNAFLGLSMFGGSEPGGTMNFTRTPQETFVYQLGILDAYLKSDKDEEFKKEGPEALADLLETNEPNELGRFTKFSDYFRYWDKIVALMVRSGFYNVGSEPIHL